MQSCPLASEFHHRFGIVWVRRSRFTLNQEIHHERETQSPRQVGVELSNSVLTSINLKEAILAGANLANSDLNKSKLEGACLKEAKLTGAKFSGIASGAVFAKNPAS